MRIHTIAEAGLETEDIRISLSYKRQHLKGIYVDRGTKAIWQGSEKHGLAKCSMGDLARLTLEATVHPQRRAGFRTNLQIEAFWGNS